MLEEQKGFLNWVRQVVLVMMNLSTFLRIQDEKNANRFLKDLSLTENALFIENIQLASTSVVDKVYDTFGLKPFQNLYVCISKLLSVCTFKFLTLDRLLSISGGVS